MCQFYASITLDWTPSIDLRLKRLLINECRWMRNIYYLYWTFEWCGTVIVGESTKQAQDEERERWMMKVREMRKCRESGQRRKRYKWYRQRELVKIGGNWVICNSIRLRAMWAAAKKANTDRIRLNPICNYGRMVSMPLKKCWSAFVANGQSETKAILFSAMGWDYIRKIAPHW